MCGRYSQTSNAELLLERFRFREARAKITPRFNIAPTQAAPILILDGQKILVEMIWGLVPSWARDSAIGSKMINARSETALEKPSFAKSFERRRCLVLADGFFEWKKSGPEKTPIRFTRRDRRPFAFAGLWDRWEKAGAEPLTTFTILTTSADALVKPVHHRMPVILRPEDEDAWLDEKTGKEALADMLVPEERGDMEAYAVSMRVNSPANDDPRCIEAVEGPQPEFF